MLCQIEESRGDKMIIAQKKILKVPCTIDINKNHYIVANASTDNLAKLGLSKYEEGITIQPSTKYGITARKNVNGYFVVEKNMSKEERFIRTIYWEWQLYNGDWQSDYRDIYKECYPKTYYEPFDIEMTLRKNKDGKEMILTESTGEKDIKNIINLYLEVFGYCEVLDEKLDSILTDTKYIRRNWEILPPDVKIEVKKSRLTKQKESKRNRKNYNQVRIDTLESYKPIERNIGKNGFQGYYAFIYENICVLESPLYGNATYIVERDSWKKSSMETKKSLISNHKFLKRIEHNSNWFKEIEEVFK